MAVVALKPGLLRRAALAAAMAWCIGLVGASSASASASSCAFAVAIPRSDSVPASRAAFLCLLNHQRARLGRRPLRVEAHLLAAAQRHAQDMVARGYFSHTTLGGSGVISRLLRSGYRWPNRHYEFGEAMGYNYNLAATPSRLLAQLLTSSYHRDKLLGARFQHVGIGVAPGLPLRGGGVDGATYTVDVGRRG